jgi:hypothetical protein
MSQTKNKLCLVQYASYSIDQPFLSSSKAVKWLMQAGHDRQQATHMQMFKVETLACFNEFFH